jgi:hypothetical protein
VTIQDPVVLGVNSGDDKSFPIELLHEASFGAKMCRIKVLKLENVVLPSHYDYQLRKMCECIINMQMLESLEVTTTLRVYMGCFYLLKGMAGMRDVVTMPSLKHITLSFAGYVPVSMDSQRVLRFNETMQSTQLVQAFAVFPHLQSIDIRDVTDTSWGSVMILNGIFHSRNLVFPRLTSFSFTFADTSSTNMRAHEVDIPFWDHISQQQCQASFWAEALSHSHMSRLEELHIRCTGTPQVIVDLYSFLLRLCSVRGSEKRIKQVHIYSFFFPPKLLTPQSNIRIKIAEDLADNFYAHYEMPKMVRTYTPGSFVQ